MHTVSSIYSIRPIRQSSLHNQSVRFETMCAPCSWYSCRVTRSDLNVASEARMDLPCVVYMCVCWDWWMGTLVCVMHGRTHRKPVGVASHAPADPGGVLALGRRRYPDLDVARGQLPHFVQEAVAKA